jgi:succinate dehydrogenase/fumarate reductase flavoprotein subunit
MSPASQHLDLVVVDSGVAVLSAAVRTADHGLRVGVVTKGCLEQATTRRRMATNASAWS